MKELQLQVVIDPGLPPIVEGAICFETGATPAQLADRNTFTYDHHGEGFGPRDKGALTSLFEDLAYGCPLPLSFVTHQLRDVDTAVAASLFLQRDLLVHPATPGFVTAVDLFHRYGTPILAHVPRDLGRFFHLLRDFLPAKGMAKEEVGDRLSTIATWVREYLLEEKLPHLGVLPTPVRVIDHGTNGFVLAESDRPSVEGWVEVYRHGFLRGILISPDSGSYRRVIASRKSPHVPFDLDRAAMVLNEMERSIGELPEWRVDGLYLHSPDQGTQILVSHMMQVFVRC